MTLASLPLFVSKTIAEAKYDRQIYADSINGGLPARRGGVRGNMGKFTTRIGSQSDGLVLHTRFESSLSHTGGFVYRDWHRDGMTHMHHW